MGQRSLLVVSLLGLSFALFSPQSAQAKTKAIKGKWVAPFGKLRFSQKGAEVQATMISARKECKLSKGQGVIKGVLLEDNLTGEITICQHGPGCAPTTKAFVILLASRRGSLLTGALHLPNKNCKVPGMRGKSGLRFFRGKAKKIKKKNDKAVYRGKVKTEAKAAKVDLRGRSVTSLLQEGFAMVQKGLAEDARLRFKAASEADPSRAEAFNGVGITYYLRQQFTDALLWYKKALEANPDFGDSFYNMACIYSLENKHELALRYLKIALLNGYAGHNDLQQIAADPDLLNIKELPEFKELFTQIEQSQRPSKTAPVPQAQQAEKPGQEPAPESSSPEKAGAQAAPVDPPPMPVVP